MKVVEFNVEALKKHQLWYVLVQNYGGDLTLCRPTPAGIDPYNNATAYRMFNGRILLGFDDVLDAQSQNGLMVIGEGTTEYVSTQPYERIAQLCAIAPPNDNLGTFIFTDSVPVLQPNTDWRCDSGRYGPGPYPDVEGVIERPIDDKSVLLQYEPIMSVPGIAHLIYVRRTNFEQQRNHFLNNATTQMATATLSEMFVLLNEWSKVSEYPFGNTEEIAQDAKQFLSAITFNESLIDGHPPMQIAKFLMGDQDARLRPSNPMPLNQQLEMFVRNRSSHLSLASLLSSNPGVWDLQDIAELEESSIKQHLASMYKHFFVNDAPDNFSLSMFRETILGSLPEGYGRYVDSWFVAYDVAEQIRQQF